MRYVRSTKVESVQKTTRTVCDFCGESTAPKDFYDRSEVELVARIGSSYPEGDNRTVYEIDCCVACFRAKVRPAIEALGVKFRERDAEDYEANDVDETDKPEPQR